MRHLISTGFLSDYRIFAPLSNIDLTNIGVTKDGDYNPQKLRQAAHKSRIVGDVVDQYLKITPGKLAITYATDVETATDIAVRFRHAGVHAKMIYAKTPDAERRGAIRQVKRGAIKNLGNVHMFG